MVIRKNIKGEIGITVIITLIILLLSGGVLIASIKDSSKLLNEKVQVNLCRFSNEIRHGYKENTNLVVDALTPTPTRICSTIDKTTKKNQVPTVNYEQNEKGASKEIRDMIKNCWFMWLEGSENNMFEKMPFGRGCFMCYVFEVKDGIGEGNEKVNFDAVQNSMDDPYYAIDRSDQCSPLGGFITDECEEGWSSVPSLKAAEQGKICCVKKGGYINECENKGGRCYGEDENADTDYKNFDGWSCKEGQCYVKTDDHFTFANYITRSPRGGTVYFIPPGDAELNSLDYAKGYGPDKKFAISFISPSRQFCATGTGVDEDDVEGPDKACIAGLVIGGTAAALLVPIGIAAAPAIGAAGISTIGTVSGVIGVKGAVLAGGTFYGAKKIGILGKMKRGFANFALKPFTKEVPSLMIVSSLEHATQMGCLVSK